MIAERSELRRIYTDSLPVFTLIPGGIYEKPAASIITFEHEALANAGIMSLQDVPKEDFACATKILAMDAIDFPEKLHVTREGRKAILAYSLYVVGNASYKYTQNYMGVATEGLLNSVLDNNDLVKAYGHFEKFTNLVASVMPSFKFDAEKVKIITNEVAMLQKEGFDDEEIPKFFKLFGTIMPRNSWNQQRARVVNSVLMLQEEGLSDDEIISYKEYVRKMEHERIKKIALLKSPAKQTEKLDEARRLKYNPDIFSKGRIIRDENRASSRLKNLEKLKSYLGELKTDDPDAKVTLIGMKKTCLTDCSRKMVKSLHKELSLSFSIPSLKIQLSKKERNR